MSTETLASATSGASLQVSSLEVRHLKKAYGSRKVVHDVSLQVNKGEVVGLLGPNGAGKTTSFYMIVGLVHADGGQIMIDGQDVTDMPIHRRSRMGLSYLPQEASIFRKLTVSENVRAVLELQRDANDKPLYFLALGILFTVNGLLVSSTYAWGAAWMARRVALLQSALRTLDGVAACMFMAFGIQLALSDAPSSS